MLRSEVIETKSDDTGENDAADVKMALQELTGEVKRIGDESASKLAPIIARLDDIEKKQNRWKISGMGPVAGTDKERALAVCMSAEHKALGIFLRKDDDRALLAYLETHEADIKSMSVGSDPEGGWSVLPVMAQTMITKIFDQSPMRAMARVETITTGDAWEEPIDKNDVVATWVGERESRPSTATAEVGTLRVPVQEMYANQPVTQRLLDDTGINLAAWMEGKLADKFGRAEGLAYVSGDGIKKPRGFLTHNIVATADATRAWGDLQYIPSTVAGGVTGDSLISLVYGVRAPYRAGAEWLMNSNTAATIRKLKDGEGNYLWGTALTAGSPDSLLGYPVRYSEDMPDIAADAYPIAFGNWKRGYLIVDKVGIKILRDPYTSKPNVLFYSTRRAGGDVANSEAIKLLKAAAS